VESIAGYELEWNSQWKAENDRFEEFLNFDPNLQKLSRKCFLCGMETITYKHGFLTLIRFILMILPSTSQWMQ
jgi:hypothetical protein